MCRKTDVGFLFNAFTVHFLENRVIPKTSLDGCFQQNLNLDTFTCEFLVLTTALWMIMVMMTMIMIEFLVLTGAWV